jgi:hypothetical protein
MKRPTPFGDGRFCIAKMRHIPDTMGIRSSRDDASHLIGEISLAHLPGRRGQGTTPTSFPGSSSKRAKRRRFWPHSKSIIEPMQTLAVISILALLTISGAAYTDQLLTREQHMMMQRGN